MDFITNLQPTKQIVPSVCPFDYPTSSLETRILLSFSLFLATRLGVRDISAAFGRPTQLRIVVALITTEMLSRLLLGRRSSNHNRIQRGAELFHVVPVSARERDCQRDAIGIREEMSLDTQFAPIRGVFSDLVPPFTGAETIAPSSDWKRQSMPLRSS